MTTVKTMQALNELIGYCTGYEGKYNPGRPNLRIENLQVLKEQVRLVLEKVKETKVHFENEVNARKQVFDQLPALASSVMRLLEASGASEEKLADARMLIREIAGRKLPVKPILKKEGATATEPTVKRSHLQLAYVSKADWFEKLVQTVAMEPLYLPNEATLTIAALNKRVEELHRLNQRVTEARVPWSNARMQRDELIRGKGESVVMIARAVKKYLRGIFGYKSPQYQQVKGIKFY
jgi:hypothetical protein